MSKIDNPEPSLYAAFIDLQDEEVLVVGGGKVAARKVGTLLESGARVTVVSPEFVPELADGARCTLIRRKFVMTDLKSQKLVFAATDDESLNSKIAKAAKKSGLLVNVAAPPKAGNMQVPATIRRGRLQIAISTGGASAGLSKSLRKLLEGVVGPEWGALIVLLESRRATVLEQIADPEVRSEVLRSLGSADWAERIRRDGVQAAAKLMDAEIAGTARVRSKKAR